ncbi:MAG: DUF4007 family protein [Gammaproteobacteria bacterium]|nr:DUF4007 family protein [Gammaproteobacteria bacterium]
MAHSVNNIVGNFGGFPLRLSWLPRMIDCYGKEGQVPSNLETVACQLGIGKNMAKALKAWARTAMLLHHDGRISDMAKRIFLTMDPYLERGETVALLHWLITSNFRNFSAAAWVFNYLHVDIFSLQNAISGFKDFLCSNNAFYADGTLRGDMEPVLRMHLVPPESHADDHDDRFFSQLRMLTATRIEGHSAYKRTWHHERPHVSDKILLYSLLGTLASRGTASSALSDLYITPAAQASPGSIFGFSKDGFFAAVERLDKSGCKELSLSTMPGEDAMVTAKSGFDSLCTSSDTKAIDAHIFGRVLE